MGRHYDLARGDAPVRVMVMGQEYGRDVQHVSLSTRHAMIAEESGRARRFQREGSHPARNPHMRGTTTILRAVLGAGPGADYDGEFLQVEDQAVHLFEAFALVNVLLCSAIVTDDGAKRGYRAAGRSTSVIQQNCRPHLRSALDILEPTIIAVQGGMVRRNLERAVDGVEPLHATLPLARVWWGSQSALALFLSHPAAHGAANWGMNAQQAYVTATILPMVQAARQQLGIG